MLTINLPPDIERYVEEKVAAGRYSSAGEVVLSALELLRQRDMSRQERLEHLRRDIEEGRQAVRRGDVSDVEEVIAELKQLDEDLAARTDEAP